MCAPSWEVLFPVSFVQTLLRALRSGEAQQTEREVNELALKSKLRSARRLIAPMFALFLTALLAIPSSGIVQAQAPPDGIVLVNTGRDFVERKKGGEFVARPLFDREIESLFYAVRDADTGDWI